MGKHNPLLNCLHAKKIKETVTNNVKKRKREVNVGRPSSETTHKVASPRWLGEWQQMQASAALSEIMNKNVCEN